MSDKEVKEALNPWTVSRGPIAATELDIRKADAINALLLRPIGVLPTKPGGPVLPFVVGIFNDIRLLLKPDLSPTPLRRAIGAFVHSKRYLFASAQPDSMRHDLDGNPIEPLSTEDRLLAQQRFLALKQTIGSRQVPEPAAPAPSKSDIIRAALRSRNKKTERQVS